MADQADPGATPRAAGRSDGPVFVVGSMRSGSTMLRLILDSHPHIAIGSETGFMGSLAAAKTIPNWKYGSDWYRRLGWTEEEFDERLRAFYAGLFSRYAQSQGKARWGEKTPFHTSHMAAMGQVFPDAVFIGIVRHPAAVAASLRTGFHYTFADALSYWTATNLDMVRAASDLDDRFVACRYEDLVFEGEKVLRDLMAFLGEPWSPGLLAHHEVQRDRSGPRVVDGSTVTTEPVDAKRAVRWSKHLSDADREVLRQSSAAALARFFGYEPQDPVHREPIVSPEAGSLLSGAELLRRRKDWEGRIDFDLRPPTLAIDVSVEELARRLERAEKALVRVRSRPAVRLSDAVHRVQRGRSLQDLREAWALVRGGRKP